MVALLKNWLKGRLMGVRHKSKLQAGVQIAQRQLYLKYRELLGSKRLPDFHETGFSVFSQFEEDGLLLYLFALLGMDQKTFVEIGSDDGINSNAANLYFHHGFHGLFIDGNKYSVKSGRRFYARYPNRWQHQPVFRCAHVTRDNINEIIAEAGYNGSIGLLSIDIDGNDYWIWDAIHAIEPQVVIIETHNVFGLRNVVVPYQSNYVYPGKHPLYHGASPVAMTLLAQKKGYRLIGANRLGFNFIFLRADLLKKEVPTVEPGALLHHPNAILGQERFSEIERWPFEKA